MQTLLVELCLQQRVDSTATVQHVGDVIYDVCTSGIESCMSSDTLCKREGMVPGEGWRGRWGGDCHDMQNSSMVLACLALPKACLPGITEPAQQQWIKEQAHGGYSCNTLWVKDICV